MIKMGETARREASKATFETPVNDRNKNEQRIRSLRSAVELTSEAVRAASVTAFDALRASAKFMGVSKSGGELSNPFDTIDAPVWSEKEIPPFIVNTSYDYCEALTIRES